ncbi:MAG: FAD-dependent oxidoreductase [Lachnospiraceae bacterium]|nr:FAD-dependent oxidoreductase [Lachnospiraceae bacterium]
MLDVVVIGSGPAGLSAAVYAKRANLKVVVVEKEYYGTGQIAESHRVDNYLGLSGINGYDLGEKFREHAENLGVEFKDGQAERFEAFEGVWKIYLKGGEILETKTVIYAAGAVHRHLGVPGEQAYSGKGVSYCATCDGAFFKGKITAVIGGGDTALDDALYLSDICSKVYLVHRRSEFRGSTNTVEKLRAKENVEFVLEAKPSLITGTDKVEKLQLEDGRVLNVDGVFVAVGMIPLTEPVKDIVEIDQAGYIVADETGKTTAKGFFAAGDVRTKALRQVVTAVSDGANAATSAEQYIRQQ